MMTALVDKIKRIQTISNDKYIFDMDLVKLIKYMKTIDTHFNQLDYLHNIPIFWYATLLEIIRRKRYNSLIHLKFAVFKDQVYYQEKKRKNEYYKQFQQFFNLNYVSELDDKTSTFTPNIFNFCDNFPIKEYIQKNENLINHIIINYNHEEYQNHGTSLYPIVEKMKSYIQELEDAIEFENNIYKNNINDNSNSNEYYEKKIRELTLQNTQLNEKIQKIEKLNENEKKELINDVKKLKEEKQELINTLNKEGNNNKELKTENEEIKNENEQFKNKINQLKIEIEKVNLILENNKKNQNIVNSNDSMNISNEHEDWISLCHFSIEQLMIYHKNVCKLLNQNSLDEPNYSENCNELFKHVQLIYFTLENNHLQNFNLLKTKLDALSSLNTNLDNTDQSMNIK
ncbi:hypothetical protein PIROE2DRAFT_19065 [Piromyces sp. E2]|nr:hypothetical protein PIROE2DRAFT_19065 [Piromyces sp. E2]|eukprot:OUM56354.1 hypothetical protein PIROE2DRAFT_19065 [Piromyces sp. E2]